MKINIEDKEFANDFRQFYKKELSGYMAEFEQERKKFLSFIIGVLFIASIGLAFLIKFTIQGLDTRVSGYYCIGIFLLVVWISKKYKTKVKSKVLPKILSFIGDFKVDKNKYPEDKIKSLNIFPSFTSISYDDRIKGLYKLLNIDIIELKLIKSHGKSSSVVFQGLLIKVPSNKKITGITVIRNKTVNPSKSKSIFSKEITLFKGENKPKFQNVKLEDTEFSKYYDVDSTDQIEARYLITTAFMNRMVNVAKSKSTNTISVSFEHGFVYISVHTPFKDWFEVPILKPANDLANYKAIVFEIIQLMKIIDSLKLEQKIGL